MYAKIPPVLFKNKITELLDGIRTGYGKISRKGVIYGILVLDEDAKVIAVDSRFDSKANFWDLASIGGALFGISRQAIDFFVANHLIQSMIILDTAQILVRSIGVINLENRKRHILVAVLTERHDVNIGAILAVLDRFSGRIRSKIEENKSIKATMKMSEQDLKKSLTKLRENFGHVSKKFAITEEE